jgi:hypothetical protein
MDGDADVTATGRRRDFRRFDYLDGWAWTSSRSPFCHELIEVILIVADDERDPIAR